MNQQLNFTFYVFTSSSFYVFQFHSRKFFVPVSFSFEMCNRKDWAGLSLYLGDLSQVAAGEVEIQDEAGEVLYHYRRCPDKVKHANAAAKKFGKLAYEGFVFKWVPSTQPRLIMEIQPHLKTKQQVFEKMINAIGE